MLGLTDRRVLFLPIAGDALSVPRVRLTGARLEERRRDARPREHTDTAWPVLTLDDDSGLGFLVDDPGEWEAALASAGVPVAEDEATEPRGARGGRLPAHRSLPYLEAHR